MPLWRLGVPNGFFPGGTIIQSKGIIMISEFTDIVPSIWGMLNQGPMTLTIILHTIIISPMYFLYQSEKKQLGLK